MATPSRSRKLGKGSYSLTTREKEQAFLTMSNVLIKQGKLFNDEYTVEEEHAAEISLQFDEFKTKCHQMLRQGVALMECAKRYYQLCHAYLLEATQKLGYKDYNEYLEGLWVENQLMEWKDREGAKRLMFLINHPGQGFNAGELMRATQPQDCIKAKPSNIMVTSMRIGEHIPPEMAEWQKELYWQLCKPISDTTKQFAFDEADSFQVEDSPVAIEKVDFNVLKRLS